MKGQTRDFSTLIVQYNVSRTQLEMLTVITHNNR